MSEPAIVLLNPTADQGRAGALRRPIERWLAHRAPSVPLLAPASADAALATLMVLAPRTRVVVVGGDGTVHALLPGFLRHGHRLGLVPAGRQNHLAQALGVAGFGWRKALAYALKARAAPLDIGELQTEDSTEHFVGSLSIGLDAEVTAHSAHAAWPLGATARRWWVLCAAWLRRRPTEARIWVDGRLAHEGCVLIASMFNTPRGHSGDAHAAARVDDGRVEAVVVDALGPLTALRLLPPLLSGQPVAHPAVHRLAGHKLLIDARRPLALAADGELLRPAGRITVQVLPRAVYAAGAHALAAHRPH